MTVQEITAFYREKLDYFQAKLGVKPAVINFQTSINSSKNIVKQIEAIALNGCIPSVQIGIYDPDAFASGQDDDMTAIFAEDLKAFGERYGGFLIIPMWEMNLTKKTGPWTWLENPKGFQRAWRRFWEVLEAKGTNRYATWSIHYYADPWFDLEGYWPGDDAVDWIGCSAYNRVDVGDYRDRSLLAFIQKWYYRFRGKNKPMAIFELGVTQNNSQYKWIDDAFATIKSLKALRSVTYWDGQTLVPQISVGDIHSLNDKSYKVLGEILRAGYFVGGKAAAGS
jgi:hypothetical protein